MSINFTCVFHFKTLTFSEYFKFDHIYLLFGHTGLLETHQDTLKFVDTTSQSVKN